MARLSAAEGNFLGDYALVENLETTKQTAAEIEKKVIEAKKTEEKINEARENYRPTAKRASLLYFLLNDLHKINPMYQFSLKVNFFFFFSFVFISSFFFVTVNQNFFFFNSYFAEGNFLGDYALVENLETTKQTAAEIEKKVIEAKKTEEKINEARENYRPTAKRASLLYFLLNDLHKINPMYQFSLKVNFFFFLEFCFYIIFFLCHCKSKFLFF